MMHASDQARLLRAARPAFESGSLEEAEALALIDVARADELRARSDTPDKRRRRARKHWSGRGAQLGSPW